MKFLLAVLAIRYVFSLFGKAEKNDGNVTEQEGNSIHPSEYRTR